MVPILFEVFAALGVDESIRMHLCVGTTLAVIMPTSLRSFYSHKAKGAVDMDIIRSMVVPVVAGVAIGVLVARFSNEDILKAVWAGSATAFSIKLFFGGDKWRLGKTIPGNPKRAIYGVFIGMVSTLMSIGGGAFITMMMTLYGRSILQSVATSSGFGPMIAIPGTIGFIWAGWGPKACRWGRWAMSVPWVLRLSRRPAFLPLRSACVSRTASRGASLNWPSRHSWRLWQCVFSGRCCEEAAAEPAHSYLLIILADFRMR